MIDIFDNKIPYQDRLSVFSYSMKSSFNLGWKDSDEPEKYILNLYSSWTKKECEESKLFPFIEECIEQTDWFTNKNFSGAYLNLVTSTSVHYMHSHRDKQIALYYVNLDWQDGWYGETLFYDKNDLNQIVFASPFIPGRIILFDGSIPHCIRPQSISAPKYRLTISFLFD